MSQHTPTVDELAETFNLYLPSPPGEVRVIEPRFALFVGARPDRMLDVVQRVRSEPADVPALLEAVRAVYRSHGRSEVTWEIGPSTRPSDLATRLRGLGLVPDADDPVVAGMLLDHEPVLGAPSIAVVRVADRARFGDFMRVMRMGFNPERGLPSEAEIDLEHARRADDGMLRYVAYDQGEPVAGAYGVPMAGALALWGGATIAHARGRGAYRALVAARWQDAVARGTPRLVVQAGSMSRPILARLGFVTLLELEVLTDRFAP